MMPRSTIKGFQTLTDTSGKLNYNLLLLKNLGSKLINIHVYMYAKLLISFECFLYLTPLSMFVRKLFGKFESQLPAE